MFIIKICKEIISRAMVDVGFLLIRCDKYVCRQRLSIRGSDSI